MAAERKPSFAIAGIRAAIAPLAILEEVNMSFVKGTMSIALAASLVVAAAPAVFAQVGGGTELPSNAEPQNAKSGNGSMATKSSSMKGGAMKKGSMKKKRHGM